MPMGPNSNILTSGYAPSPDSTVFAFKVTVTNAATRLKDLITTAGGTWPLVENTLYQQAGADSPLQSNAVQQRPPWHVMFQVIAAAANPVYCTWDNNTAPVVGGPGAEFEPGVIYRFENAGVKLLRAQASGLYLVNAKSAFQFIATGNTTMLVTFSD